MVRDTVIWSLSSDGKKENGKRPLASAAFRPLREGDGDDRRELRRRWEQARLDSVVPADGAPATLLRWALAQPVVDHVLVGTSKLDHLAAALAAAGEGALDDAQQRAIDEAVAPHKASWPGLI